MEGFKRNNAMSFTKRIIPCLDVKDGQTVKGIHFENLRFVGDPVELGLYYSGQGADELVFLDISATNEKRKTMAQWVRKVAEKINIPFTVGGGITDSEDVKVLLENGADKISINSAAVKNPKLIDELAGNFGSQCVVLAVDIKFVNDNWYVYLNGGRVKTDILANKWVIEAVSRGAGEILLTSMDNDGDKSGFAIEITREISSSVSVPIIASGGAGSMQHFADVFSMGLADAALAASVFHFKEIAIPELKDFLYQRCFPVRT
jgi:cyclase